MTSIGPKPIYCPYCGKLASDYLEYHSAQGVLPIIACPCVPSYPPFHFITGDFEDFIREFDRRD